MTGMMGGGKSGGGGGSPFDQAALGTATQDSARAVHNRYAQLGIGVPGGGQTAAGAAAGGTSLTAGGPSTMELQDLGPGVQDPGWPGVEGIPSEQGGIAGLLAANQGQLQNTEMTNPAFTPAGQLGSLVNQQSAIGNLASQQQGQAGVAAGIQAG